MGSNMTWDELYAGIRQSVPQHADWAERLVAVIQATAANENFGAAHLTGRTTPGTQQVVLDMAVIAGDKLYGFTLYPSSLISTSMLLLKHITTISTEERFGEITVSFGTVGGSTLSFTDDGQKTAQVLGFVQQVARLI